MSNSDAPTFEELLQTDKKLQVFNDTVPAGILILSADDGRVVLANRFFSKFLGADGENLLGQSWESFFVDPDERQALLLQFVEFEEVRNFEIRLRGKDGKEMWGLSSLSTVNIDDEELLLFAFVNITAQKELELAFVQAQSVAKVGSWRLNLLEDELYWSDEIFNIFGIDPSKFEATLEAFFGCIYDEDLEAVQTAYQESVDKDVPYDIEHRIIRKDTGDLLWVHEKCMHERNAAGEVIRSYGTVQDITDRKLAEEKLHQREEELRLRTEEMEITSAKYEEQAQEMVGLAEELHFLKEKAELLSITDRLTGLFNRLKLDQAFAAEIDRSQRYEHPLSMIMFDLDHFKSVNDTYGHQVGDDVLVAIATLLKESIRTVDIAGRWGGEEFLVICPETNIDGAVALAEKIRESIRSYDFPSVGQKTASFGVSEYKAGEDANAFTQRADEALYSAKENGRDRVETG